MLASYEALRACIALLPPRRYDQRVSMGSGLEDERGVDRQQIRELLTLTPAERVDRLVTTVAVWNEVLAQAGGSPDAQ
jgi:hypothetical protein